TISFALEPPSAGGATLAAASAVTDYNGNATASIRTGLAAEFAVQTQGDGAEGGGGIVVESGATGDVVVAPFLAPPSPPPPAGESVKVVFEDVSCDHLTLDQPPEPMLRTFTLDALGETALVPFVSTQGVSSAIAEMLSPTSVVTARGCVNVPG